MIHQSRAGKTKLKFLILKRQDSLSQLEREKRNIYSELQFVTSKFKETETRLAALQSEMDGVSREKDAVNSKLSH